MNRAAESLRWAARHGRFLLVAGLLAGVGLPGVAAAMRPWLPELVAALLFLAILRIGPRQAVGALSDVRASVALIGVYQIALPLLAIGIFAAVPGIDPAVATAVTLMLAAAPLAGSPNLAILTGFDPAPALRLLVLGTAALPLTVLPVFWALPDLEGPTTVLASSGRLLAVILIAAAGATALRPLLSRSAAAPDAAMLDGLSAIMMAVVVVALMSAVGPALRDAPGTLGYWMVVAVAANLGMQLLAAVMFRAAGAGPGLVALSIVAGNRNIALFLVSLPEPVAEGLLIFIGCYQVPMYLTPLLMAGFYRRVSGAGAMP